MVGQATLAIGAEQVEVLYQLEEQRNARMAGTLSLLLSDPPDQQAAQREQSIRLEDGRLFRFRVTRVDGRVLHVAGTVIR
jgi:hypothetical protein